MSFVFRGKLQGKIALVTGASRGVGKGVATMLVQSGATVYITGREKSDGEFNVKQVAQQLNELNLGKCHYVYCDHGNDKETEAVFDKISTQHNDQLDILVNNAFQGVSSLGQTIGHSFWDIDYKYWDDLNNVGLRSAYVCSVLAARMMVKRNSGLIVNISSIGGIVPLFSAAYGVGKEANDRMAQELAREIKVNNVTVVSLWPGCVRTETMTDVVSKNPRGYLAKIWDLSEDPTLTGKAIVALASDGNKMKFTGKVLIVAELASHYDFVDVNDKYPVSMRSLKFNVHTICPRFSWLVPGFIKIPGWLLSAYYNKF